MSQPVVKRYYFTFMGRKRGAIGIFYQISAEIYATNFDEACIALSEKYDRQYFINWTEWTHGVLTDSKDLQAARMKAVEEKSAHAS